MKTSNISEFSAPGASSISFGPLSAKELNTLLLPFYLRLGFDARRTRFGCAVSDDSIARYCQGLSLAPTVVLGCIRPTGLIAAIEIHPLLSNWEYAELAFANSAENDRTMISGHLLQLAAFAAGKRGCHTLIVPADLSQSEIVGLLRGMGRVTVQDDSAFVDLGEYARVHGLSVGRP
jgi:hypothetical protein